MEANENLSLNETETEALEAAYSSWTVENNHALTLGGFGDLRGLLCALMAASEKTPILSLSIPKASLKSETARENKPTCSEN